MSTSVQYEVCVVDYYYCKEDDAAQGMWSLFSGKDKVIWVAEKEEADGSERRVAASDPFRAKFSDVSKEPMPYEAEVALKQLSQKLLRDGWEFVGAQTLTGNKQAKVFRRRLVAASPVSNSPSVSGNQPEVIQLISMLAELNKAGVLTNEEFAQKKKDLLRKL